MKRKAAKIMGILLSAALMLNGCTAGAGQERGCGPARETEEGQTQELSLPFGFKADAETFALSAVVNDEEIQVSEGVGRYTVENYREGEDEVSWEYPDEKIRVRLAMEDDYLEIQITSESEEDNTFVWPQVSADQYYIPFGEGKRVPADDPAWIAYLDQRQMEVMEQLSMPFWISSSGDYNLLFIMDQPFRTQMNFSAEPEISFSVSHEYPKIDSEKTNRYRLYVTENNPVKGAKIYRNDRIAKGEFVTLKQKAEQNPEIEKLYGAPFFYLWGDFVISDEDIEWGNFRQALDAPIMDYLRSFSGTAENGSEFQAVLEELRDQDYVAEYQKNVICGYISQVLKKDGFWDPDVFLETGPYLEELLKNGYEGLSASQKLQVHKYALAANLPEVFHGAESWMDGGTTELIRDMGEMGIDRAWIGLNSWEQAYAKPELVRAAVDAGYLIASYDSYHSIHEPGKEQWITAKFDDPALYEEAAVTDKNGEKEAGFQDVGRKLNPALSLPSVKSRMEGIMANGLPFNSWFIDCDAAGEIYDDYTPGHITTQRQDLAARMERMAYIRDQYKMAVGSEGGNDFASSTIAFAHGIELKSFSWMDEDMKNNRDSEFYIGKYYNPSGGVAEHFAKRIPVKPQYLSVFVDQRYDVPLFRLVYNDSVITSYHWDWSTFKIKGETQDRMIREILYNVPSLYHIDQDEWDRYKRDIAGHHKVWSEFSVKAVREEMTDFTYLKEDGTVQRTRYGGDLTAVANFGDAAYAYEGEEIPPHSVWIGEKGGHTIYTPSLDAEHQ